MAITLDTIQQLCMEGESNHLDYKREQYQFIGVSDPEKTELLKDILAMANAFRQQTAYILIGVEQQPDGSGKIIGISSNDFIDDSQLQQFINGKTNRVVNFLSYSVQIDAERIIQVIEIPLQDNRPYYPKRQIGEIKGNEVLFRVSSSTRTATPDEIAQMAVEQQKKENPEVDIFLHIPTNPVGQFDSILGYELHIEPGFTAKFERFEKIYVRDSTTLNRYPKQIDFVKNIFKTIRIDIGLENISTICVENPIVECLISQCSQYCITQISHAPFLSSQIINTDSISDTLLRPQQTKIPFKSLYFEINNNGIFTLEVKVLGSNLPIPIVKEFKIAVKSEKKTINLDSVKNFCNSYKNEDIFFKQRAQLITEEEDDNA